MLNGRDVARNVSTYPTNPTIQTEKMAHYLKKGFHSFQVFAVTFEVLFELGSLTDFLHHFMEAIKCSNEST